jgi:hypothetical protein
VVPSTQDEVVAAVKAAAAQPGGNLRCIGHGNTWTPAFFDEVWQSTQRVRWLRGAGCLLVLSSMHACRAPQSCSRRRYCCRRGTA